MHLRLASVCRVPAAPGEHFPWHVHDSLDELCLVEHGRTTIGHAGEPHAAEAGDLFLFLRGERHGFWNAPAAACVLRVAHFDLADPERAVLAGLFAPPPALRRWRLSPDQRRDFTDLHARVATARHDTSPHAALAARAWLLALLAGLAGWRDPGVRRLSPAVARLRAHLVAAAESGAPAPELRAFPNYDSLRHRFRRETGFAPLVFWRRLRLERARVLLLDTPRSVKEIAAALGYARQHEFSRAFRQAAGLAPAAWRAAGGVSSAATSPVRRG